MDMLQFIQQLNQETKILLVLSIILFSGFIMTRLTNTLNMPKVSGYILAGILIGPCCLDFIPHDMIGSMGFISDIALAFIAFGVGKFFKKEVIMKTGKRIIVITFSEALVAGILVTLLLKVLFGLDWGFALILGAIATATAPASTMMTINQYKAKGEFVNTLLQIVALDDVVCLLAFSIVSAVINGSASGTLAVSDIVIPIIYNFIFIAVGVFCGYFLSRLLIPARSRDNRLILAIAMLLGISGLCAIVDVSPLLSCMVFGAVYINLTRDKKLFRQINNFTPPIMSIFFIVSGMNLDLTALTTVGAIGVAYFLIRIAGKYLGTYLSCQLMGTSKEIRNYMGLALIPQAGVAIGLAFLGQRILPSETGDLMLAIILSSSVLYEMIGPISAKAALFLSGSIPGKNLGDMIEVQEEEKIQGEDDGHQEEDTGEEHSREDHTEEDHMEEEHSAGEGSETEGQVLEEDPDGQESETAQDIVSDERGEYEEGKPLGQRRRKKKKKKPSGGENPEEESGEASSEKDGLEEDRFGEKESQEFFGEQEEYHDDGDEYVMGLPELHEYNKGVDERDDYDVERENKPGKNRRKKKKKKSVQKEKHEQELSEEP